MTIPDFSSKPWIFLSQPVETLLYDIILSNVGYTNKMDQSWPFYSMVFQKSGLFISVQKKQAEWLIQKSDPAERQVQKSDLAGNSIKW